MIHIGKNNNNKVVDINRTVSRKPRTKLKAINNFLMCCLCKGYIIEATAISDCLHSFCRSCIVKHLTDQTYCPKCGMKNVSKANLRPDDIIKSLVYKVVPALFQSESHRIKKFNKIHKIHHINSNGSFSKENIYDEQNDDELNENQQNRQHYFSPDEPISLSLTYHTESLVGSGVHVTGNPPINYLQCPAAVTVHHLKRFVSAKYGIDIERDVNIEIICEDEVLPEDFTLIDVAYCFNWTRACPMQLMYRIFLHVNNNDNQHKDQKDIALPVENNNSELNKNNNTRKQNDNNHELSSNNDNRYSKNIDDNKSGYNNGGSSTNTKYTDNKFLVPSTDFKRLRSNATISSFSGTNVVCNINSSIKNLDSKKPMSSSNSSKNEISPPDGIKPFNYKTCFTSSSTKVPFAKTIDQEVNKEKPKSSLKTSNKLATDETSHTFISTKTKETNKFFTKNQLHDTDKDDLKLKYESDNIKKCYANPKKIVASHSNKSIEKTGDSDETKQEIPKLRIELPYKSKVKPDTMQSKDVTEIDGSKPKIILKLPSPIDKRPTPIQNANVDVTEYAKNIGLLPVSELQQRKRKDIDREDLSHKKRKKAKHSKEPNIKKRKIHAEVSSLTLDDEVKLKVKISKPPSKHEKRSNIINDDKVKVSAHSNDQQSNIKTTVTSTKDNVKDTITEKSITATSSILRSVRHKPMVFIPNVGKNIPETQDTISDIVKRVQGPVTKSPITNVIQTPNKSPIPKATSTNSPILKASSPISNFANQQGKSNSGNNLMNPIDALSLQSISNAQVSTGNMMLMPPFTAASLFDIRMRRMSSPSNSNRSFSPRPTNSLLSLPSPSSAVTLQQKNKAISGLSTYLPQQQKQPVKRTAGSDTPIPMPKTPRLNHFDLGDSKNTGKKQVYAPMIDLSSVTKASESRPLVSKPVSQVPKQFKSTDQKKPLPRLIAPSSISVTRVGDSQSNVPVPQINRPAVEILKIPSTVPAIDQKSSTNNSKTQHKTTRPPPGTIPLFKIQKSLQSGKAVNTQMNTNKTRTEGDKALDLSLSPTNISTIKKVDGAVIDLTDSNEGINNKKSSNERPNTGKPVTTNPANGTNSNNTNKSDRSSKPAMPGLTALVIPKLHEISKNSSLVRQQNLSVRNIPNPSALAFRHQATTVSTPSLTKITSAPVSKLNEKVQQLHNLKELQQRQRIAPED